MNLSLYYIQLSHSYEIQLKFAISKNVAKCLIFHELRKLLKILAYLQQSVWQPLQFPVGWNP